MKREEASNYITEWLKDEYALTIKDRVVLNMALKALEQEPCEDLIDRAEAMTEIMMFAGNVKSDEEDVCIKVSDAVQLLRELPPVTPTQSWIPVSERLPEKRGYYIVTEKVFSLDDREHKGRFNIMTEQVEWSGEKWQRARFYEVTAWMPLPKPYKAESEDKE